MLRQKKKKTLRPSSHSWPHSVLVGKQHPPQSTDAIYRSGGREMEGSKMRGFKTTRQTKCKETK